MKLLLKKATKFFLIVLVLNFLLCPVYALTVAVVKSQELAPYNEALSGFKEELNKGKKYDVDFFYYDLKEEGIDKIKNSIKARNADLILALGSEAAKETKEKITDIPVVFCVVLEPVKNGLIRSSTGSGTNLAGVALDVPVATQFKYLKEIDSSISKIGVVFNPSNSDSAIEEAERSAEMLGLKLVKKIISSPKEVPAALESLKGNVDALWGLLDPTVFSGQSLPYILQFTLKEKIPFLGFSPTLVEAGALLSVYADYEEIGRRSGEIALRIFSGEKPSQIALYYPKKALVAVNLKAAQWINKDISEQFIRKADKVFK